jgi:chaperonin GroES
VLVEKIAPPAKSVGGVLLPESAVQKINSALVVAVGPGRRNANGELVPVGVKEGDKVLLPDYGGTTVKLQEKEYHIYRDDEILGILTE